MFFPREALEAIEYPPVVGQVSFVLMMYKYTTSSGLYNL
jgi:hypothetical protein